MLESIRKLLMKRQQIKKEKMGRMMETIVPILKKNYKTLVRIRGIVIWSIMEKENGSVATRMRHMLWI